MCDSTDLDGILSMHARHLSHMRNWGNRFGTSRLSARLAIRIKGVASLAKHLREFCASKTSEAKDTLCF